MADTWSLVPSPGLANRWDFQKQDVEGPPLSSCQQEGREAAPGCSALRDLVGIWGNQTFWKEMRQGSEFLGLHLSHLEASA